MNAGQNSAGFGAVTERAREGYLVISCLRRDMALLTDTSVDTRVTVDGKRQRKDHA